MPITQNLLYVKALVVVLIALLGHGWLISPDILLVGPVTKDVFDASESLGGSVSYAAVVAAGFGLRACVLVSANPKDDLDMSSFQGHSLYTVKTNATLTFGHTYTWWGSHRVLHVLAEPSVKLSLSHIPWRCRGAKTVLLGPLTANDMDISSFTKGYPLWWRLLGWSPPKHLGIMAQGLQRKIDAKDGRVGALTTPSSALTEALTPYVTVFLSDVETDAWKNGTVEALARDCKEFVVTRGSAGADRYLPDGTKTTHAPFEVPGGVGDTNGAGDSFAMGYMHALDLGHTCPPRVANWAGAKAVSMEQACKPGCIKDAIRNNLAELPPSTSTHNTSLYRLLNPFRSVNTLFALRKVLR